MPVMISGLRFIKKMFICSSNELADFRTLFLLKDYGFFIFVAIILCFPIVPKFDEKLADNQKVFTIYEVVKALIIMSAFVWAVSFVVAGQNNPFAYANF